MLTKKTVKKQKKNLKSTGKKAVKKKKVNNESTDFKITAEKVEEEDEIFGQPENKLPPMVSRNKVINHLIDSNLSANKTIESAKARIKDYLSQIRKYEKNIEREEVLIQTQEAIKISIGDTTYSVKHRMD